MKFAIGSIHRAGSNYLAYVLNQAVLDLEILGEEHNVIPGLANNIVYKIHSQEFNRDDLTKEYADKLNRYFRMKGDFGQICPPIVTGKRYCLLVPV